MFMKLEVLLSVMNLDKNQLDNMNITTKCTVINQCGENNFSSYNNFSIYSSNEIGLSNSRNLGIEKITSDIILLCDDDVVYNDFYEQIILDEFNKHKDADVIIFNMYSPNRNNKIVKKNKKLHRYNTRGYASQSIAFKKNSILKKRIVFNTLFGAGAIYTSGEDTLFISDCLKKKLNVYCCDKYIGTVNHTNSTWFNGYNRKYFFDKGAVYTAMNYRFRKLLMKLYLHRHKEVLDKLTFKEAYECMKRGSMDYLRRTFRRKY